jgi:hypothetical protein
VPSANRERRHCNPDHTQRREGYRDAKKSQTAWMNGGAAARRPLIGPARTWRVCHPMKVYQAYDHLNRVRSCWIYLSLFNARVDIATAPRRSPKKRHEKHPEKRRD